MTPTQQRKQTHKRRKVLARTRHQLNAARRTWLDAWSRYRRGRGPKPARIRLPRAVRQHKVTLYREFLHLEHPRRYR